MGQVVSAFVVMSIAPIVAAQTQAVEQTVCPVMEENPIKKDIFVEYQGKRVYFCCASCKAQFLKEPGKYLRNLPQFSEPVAHQVKDPAHEHHDGHFSTASLIVPLGISTFVLMTTTLLAGAFMRKNRKFLFPWHRRLAVVTLLAAIAHVLCILLAH